MVGEIGIREVIYNFVYETPPSTRDGRRGIMALGEEPGFREVDTSSVPRYALSGRVKDKFGLGLFICRRSE